MGRRDILVPIRTARRGRALLRYCIETRRSLLLGKAVYETLSVISKCAVHECLAKRRIESINTGEKSNGYVSFVT